uniref:Uncharacterized protein n=2 Tax=Oryza TaxID=4527 RepID=A0A0D3GAV2_9ORYZ
MCYCTLFERLERIGDDKA